MANNFNWIDATTLNGVFWESGTLLSATPIIQIGTLTIGGTSSFDDKYLNAQLNNTNTIIHNSISSAEVYFSDGAILNNLGIYEFQQGGIYDDFVGLDNGVFNNTGTLNKTQ